MINLHIPLEDKDVLFLKKLKGENTWKEFIFKAARCYEEHCLK